MPPQTPSTSLKTLAQQFLEHLEIEKGRSQNTLHNYDFYLGRFVKYLAKQDIHDARAITQEHVRLYRLWLNRLGGMHPLKKNTQNYHLIALRSFLKYLAKRDLPSLPPEKIELAKMPQRTVEFLDGDDLTRLLAAPHASTNPLIIQARDKAILEMLFSTGLRVSELVGLEKEGINLEKPEFSVRGKGDKVRIVFMSPSTQATLKIYLSMRKDMLPPLFIRHDRASTHAIKSDRDADEYALTPRSVQRLIQKYARSAGITKEITPHTMRHSFATDLLMNGADIRSVQSLLGHASITTTQVYTHITNQQLREVHRAFHGKKRSSTKTPS